MNEMIQKMIKPPYIFIVIGVVILAIFMKNKNSIEESGESTYTGEGQFDIISDYTNDVMEYINTLRSDMSILEDKMTDNIIQLSDVVRLKDENLTKDIKELKDDLDDRKTTVIPKTSSKIVTVGTWGKDPISKTTLSGIAKNAGISLNKLLDLNPQYKNNPNLIRPGEKVKVS